MKKSWLWLTIAGFAAVVLLGTIVGMIGCTNNVETNIENVNLPVPPEGGEETGGGSHDEFATTTTTHAPVPPGGGEAVPGDPEFGPTTTSTSTTTTTTTTTSTTSTTTTTIALDVTIVTVDDSGEGCIDIDIDVDSEDHVNISYCIESSADLGFATNRSGSWVTETIVTTNDTGYFTSIDHSSTDRVFISYWYDTGDDLYCFTRDLADEDDDWSYILVDPGNLLQNVIGYTSIVLDSTDHFHISYNTLENRLKHAYGNFDDWDHETVDANDGQWTSIALDSSDNLHISYYNLGGGLKYVTNSSGDWGGASIIDSDGDVGRYSSIGLDSSDHVHISYYDLDEHDIKYITNASGEWVPTIIDDNVGSTLTPLQYLSSLAVDSADKIHISYYDAVNDDLKYATNASGSWVVSTIDSTGDVGIYSAIDVDSNDDIHIAYYDKTNRNLKYAFIDRE